MTSSWSLIVGLLGLSASCVYAAPDAAAPRLCPQPQEMRVLGEQSPLDLSHGLTVFNLSQGEAPVAQAVSRLTQSQKAQHAAGKATCVAVGLATDWNDSAALAKLPADLKLPQSDLAAAIRLPAEGYILRAKGDSVWIVGKDARGAAYGVETLSELISNAKTIPALEIKDWPAISFRAAYTVDMPLENLRSLAASLVRYKLNYLVIESDNYYNLPTDEEAVRVTKEKFDYLRSVGIEPIPEVQSCGHAGSVLAREPAAAEATPMNDRSMTFGADDIAFQSEKARSFTVKVANGKFEDGQGNEFPGWNDTEKCVSAGKGQDGSRCAVITRSTPGMARISQAFDVLPKGRYELTLDMKTDKEEGFFAYFEVYAGERHLVNGGLARVSSDWKRQSIRFESGDSTTVTLYMRIQEGTGKAWFDNVECRMIDDPILRNLIVTPEQPVIVKSLDGKKTYREGADYSLTAGKMSPPPFVPDKATPWKLNRISSGAIKAGETVRVSYNWVPEDSESYCPSDPRTRKLMEKTITATMQVLKPKYLHIGHDEPSIINVDGRCRSRGMRAYEIFADDVSRMQDCARKVDPNVRVMIWADVYYRKDKGQLPFAFKTTELCTFEEAVKPMPKDVVMCVWWYDGEPSLLSEMNHSLMKAGFNTTVSPWYDLPNTYNWAKIAQKSLNDEKFLGIFLTTWDGKWQALPFCSDLMWKLDTTEFDNVKDTTELQKLIAQRYAGFAVP